jgi:lactoylglutathione lyase
MQGEVLAAAEYLEKYFGMTNQGGNKGFTVLFDDDGLVLSVMKGSCIYPETFYIGFGQESEAKVNQIYEVLKADGFDVAAPERHHAWTFYVKAPGGFTVEVMA